MILTHLFEKDVDWDKQNSANNGPYEESFLEDNNSMTTNEYNNNIINIVYESTNDYLENSSIHGLKYLASSNILHRKFDRQNEWAKCLRKIFWIISMCIVFFCFILLSCGLFDRWQQSPIIINRINPNEPIWNIPFPAVTICPQQKSLPSLMNYTSLLRQIVDRNVDELSDEQQFAMEALSLVCNPHSFDHTNFGNNVIAKRVYQKLIDLSESIENVFLGCKVHNQFEKCSKFFAETWTSDGNCLTFNMLNGTDIFTNELSPEIPTTKHNFTSRHWAVDEGYHELAHETESEHNITFPYRSRSKGNRGAIYIVLNQPEQETDPMCGGLTEGYTVHLHQPDQLPESGITFRVPHNQETLVVVRPKKSTISKRLGSYSPKERNCYKGNEKKLRFFKTYSQHNCELECLAKKSIENCGCVQHSLPRDSNTPICGLKSFNCIDNLEDNYLNNNIFGHLKTGELNCDCLPSCSSIKYLPEISHSPYNWKNSFNFHSLPSSGYKLSRIAVMLDNNRFESVDRDVHYDVWELFALFGALLALFFGFSVLSFFEVIWWVLVGGIRILIGKKQAKRQETESLCNLAGTVPV